MKSIKYILVSLAALALNACDGFIDVPPTGVVDGELAYSQPEKMVTAAYASLGDCWFSYPFNLWPYGDLASDDCLKGGGGTTDTGYHPMEIWSTLTSTPGELDELWYRLYCNISRCNRALYRSIPMVWKNSVLKPQLSDSAKFTSCAVTATSNS